MNIRRLCGTLIESFSSLFSPVMTIKVPGRAQTQLYTAKVEVVCSTLSSVRGTNKLKRRLVCVVSGLGLFLHVCHELLVDVTLVEMDYIRLWFIIKV